MSHRLFAAGLGLIVPLGAVRPAAAAEEQQAAHENAFSPTTFKERQ